MQIQEYAFPDFMDDYVITKSEKFTNEVSIPALTPNMEELKSDENTLGVIVQSGSILYLGSQYISIERNDCYNLFSIDGFKFSGGRILSTNQRSSSVMSNAVCAGGIFISANLLASLPI